MADNTPQNIPNDDAAAEALLRQMIQDELKKNTPPGTPAEPEPLKMNIGGQEMTFKDMAEAQAHINNTLGQYQNQINQFQQQPNHRVVTSDDDNGSPKFDQKKFVDLMVENPLAAFDYADEFRYGMKEPTKVIKQSLNAIPQLAQEAIIRNWVDRHPEWEFSNENSTLMEQQLKELNLPISPQGLEAAYQVGRSRGLFKFDGEGTAPVQPPQQNIVPFAPPVASRPGAASQPNVMDDLDNLSDAQLESLIRKFGG